MRGCSPAAHTCSAMTWSLRAGGCLGERWSLVYGSSAIRSGSKPIYVPQVNPGRIDDALKGGSTNDFAYQEVLQRVRGESDTTVLFPPRRSDLRYTANSLEYMPMHMSWAVGVHHYALCICAPRMLGGRTLHCSSKCDLLPRVAAGRYSSPALAAKPCCPAHQLGGCAGHAGA